MGIRENIEQVRDNIRRAAQQCGRNPGDITLLAVTKTVDVERISQAVDCGLTVLGENRVQELLEKYPLLPGVQWHLIGHLQTNKVKYIIDKVSLIHSVDSARLAHEIDRQAAKVGKVQDVLLEVNISGEESKFGVPVKELPELVECAAGLEHIRVRGLMTIPPAGASCDENKKLFEICNNLFVDIGAKKYHNISMDILSMGMSGDYETAITCGSTIVRVGTGIFGARNYTQQ